MKKTKTLVLSALFAALIMVFTVVIRIPIGINNGYIHVGDSMIYIVSSILPLPYAAVSAAIGGFLADILAGAPAWAPWTAVIKALNVLPFGILYIRHENRSKIVTMGSLIMSIVSGCITIIGYYIAEGIMYSFPGALLSIPFNALQAFGSTVIFIVFGTTLDRMNLIEQLKEGR